MKTLYVRHSISVWYSLENSSSSLYSNKLSLLRIFLPEEFLLIGGNTTKETEFVFSNPVAFCNSTVVLVNYIFIY